MTSAAVLRTSARGGRPIQAGRRRASSVGYWNLSWLAAAIALSLFVARVGEFLGPIRLLKPVFSATIGLLLLHASFSTRGAWMRLSKNTQFRLAICYFATIALSVPMSVWRGQSFAIFMIVPWAFGLLTLMGMTRPTLADADRVAQVFPIAAAFTAIAAVLGGQVVEGSRITTSGSYDPNDLGALFGLALPFALAGIMRGSVPRRLFCGVLSVVLLVTLLMTGSRGGLLALLSGLVMLVASMKPRSIVGAFVVAALAIPVTWQFAPPVMKERAASLLALDEDYNTTSNSGRLYLWRRGVVFALRNPVVGIGAGTFEVEVGNDLKAQGTWGAWHTAHNTVVQVFAELGFAGGMLLLTLLGRALMLSSRFWSWRRRVYRPEWLAGLSAYITAAMFLSHAYSYLMWGAIGMSIMLENLNTAAGGLPQRHRNLAHDLKRWPERDQPPMR